LEARTRLGAESPAAIDIEAVALPGLSSDIPTPPLDSIVKVYISYTSSGVS
jgi:hypothetical protein